MARIAIIGIKGVGMAHAIACAKGGHKVVSVLDSDPRAVERLGFTWRNCWGKIEETAIVDYQPFFTTHIGDFRAVHADLLIIATPTRTHVDLIRQLWKHYPQILCEKPLSYWTEEAQSLLEIPTDIYVSHEWLFHSTIPWASPIRMDMGHNNKPEEAHIRERGVWWDLGIHLCAAYCAFSSQEPGAVVKRGISPDLAYVQYEHVEINVGYDWNCDYELLYLASPGDAKVVSWEDDLFIRQIDAVLEQEHPVPLEIAIKSIEMCRQGDIR